MGKYGAHELNYSSDIDLIVFYCRECARLGPAIDHAPFFVQITRDLVHILQERTADGYVFRTDLRLRPDPNSTQAAISTEAAFHYYESLGQNWERAALIKARPVAGDIPTGNAFLKALEPYIWRKYLDFNAIADIHAMKRQIHAAKGHERIAIAGHNLKLGRGGIREIEFFVQSQQLIAGGRQPALRTRETLAGLSLLTQFNWIGASVRDDLSAAYRFLRSMEHRLQMVADQQTHTLPASEEELAKFARFAGFASLDAFSAETRRHMQAVEAHYAQLFESTPELTPRSVKGNLVFTGDTDDPGTVDTLSQLGFRNPSAAIAAVKGWHYGRYRAMRSERAREILTEFMPALLEVLGETSDPDLALGTFDNFLKETPSALQLFSMLRANPHLLRLIAQIMGSAPRLAHILSRRRRLMDAILDPGYIGERPSEAELKALVRREIFEANSYEERLDRARVTGQEQAFAIGVRLFSRQLAPAEAGEDYSLVAEAVIENLLDAVQEQYGGGFPAPAVIGMGKLGGPRDGRLLRLGPDRGLRHAAGYGAPSLAPLRADDAAADLGDLGADARRRALSGRYAAQALGQGRPRGRAARRLSRLSTQGSLDLGASGADAGRGRSRGRRACGRGLRRTSIRCSPCGATGPRPPRMCTRCAPASRRRRARPASGNRRRTRAGSSMWNSSRSSWRSCTRRTSRGF